MSNYFFIVIGVLIYKKLKNNLLKIKFLLIVSHNLVLNVLWVYLI